MKGQWGDVEGRSSLGARSWESSQKVAVMRSRDGARANHSTGFRRQPETVREKGVGERYLAAVLGEPGAVQMNYSGLFGGLLW